MAIQKNSRQDVLILRTDLAIFRDSEARELVRQIKDHAEAIQMVVFDFNCVDLVDVSALRILTMSLGSISQKGAKVALIARPGVVRMIHELGLERLFPCYPSFKEVPVGKTSDQSGSNNETLVFLNTTIEAIIYTLGVSAQTEAKPGKPAIRNSATPLSADLVALVGIVSKPFQGSLILGFPESTYLQIISRLMGSEFTELTPDIRDGAAELLNIILGQAKTSLNERGFELKQAIPQIIQGKGFHVGASHETPSILIDFTSSAGPFCVELTTNSPIALKAAS